MLGLRVVLRHGLHYADAPSAYRPSSCARHALRWDSTAILSCMSRVMPYAAATFSEVMPMGSRQLRACSLAST